jgi:hypothetical protein
MALSDSSYRSSCCSVLGLGAGSGFTPRGGGLPGSVQETSTHASGLLTPGNQSTARKLTQHAVLPSRSPNAVSIPKLDFGAQYRAYAFPCQRLTAILANSRP